MRTEELIYYLTELLMLLSGKEGKGILIFDRMENEFENPWLGYSDMYKYQGDKTTSDSAV